jgi:putative protease|tara:strand:- start:225 stop:506 length:282 start_codon:yes stop_codon:yes gene_type:complete
MTMTDQFIGTVVHQWRQVGAALVAMSEGELHIGDTIHIKGHTTDFTQRLESMQVDHEPIESAKAGGEVAIGVTDRVRVQDKVFRVSDGDPQAS